MYSLGEIKTALLKGKSDGKLAELYGTDPDCIHAAGKRAAEVIEGFKRAFHACDDIPAALFSSPGRTELGGNHTDHQRGRVLCGSVDMDILACAAPNAGEYIRVTSAGFDEVRVSLHELWPAEKERHTSAALVRGVAAAVKNMRYALNGMDIYLASRLPVGAGLSSSAAFEVLLGSIMNHFCCNDKLTFTDIAKTGRYAENEFFGKPCGLMDQMACAAGGIAAIDFADPEQPALRRVEYDFASCGYSLCIVDTRSSHADLSADYAAVTAEMRSVAEYFGGKVLRDVNEAEFMANIKPLRAALGDRAVLRAMHFYQDDRRAAMQAEALERGDFDKYLSLVNESGVSSATLLQNNWTIADTRNQAIAVAIAVGKRLLNGTGAIRVHGGGFAGTVQAYVPCDRLEAFRCGMEEVFGEGCCHVTKIRPLGCTLVQ